MKIRDGFVSNSSSSSFLVAFPKIPKSPEDVKKILKFGDSISHPFEDSLVDAITISKVIYNDISSSNPNDIESINKVINDITFAEGYNDNIMRDVFGEDFTQNPKWKELEFDEFKCYKDDKSLALCMDKREKQKNLLFNHYTSKLDTSKNFLYVFEYSDHDPLGEIMEHGDIFANLPHIEISHH